MHIISLPENIMDIEKIALIAQKISFAFEDLYPVKEKREKFYALFDRYLSGLDSSGTMHPYDAIILLARKFPEEFDMMVKEMEDSSLITD
jgi:hypothetical protein